MNRHRIFTITGGRTGTDWLAAFFRANGGPDWTCVHEFIGVDDFGTRTPDIRTLRHFNTYGMTPVVRQFWQRKLALLPDVPIYFESSHPLAKAGLLEALADADGDDQITFIVLRRNWHKQITSYLNRNDFGNLTLMWQWYLDPRYPRRLVDPKPLLPYGQMGQAVWYAVEVEARQEYYRLLYGDRFRFFETTLEELTQGHGAQKVMREFGLPKTPVLPEPRNANQGFPPRRDSERLAKLIANLHFDAKAVAQTFLDTGARLHQVPVGQEADAKRLPAGWVRWRT